MSATDPAIARLQASVERLTNDLDQAIIEKWAIEEKFEAALEAMERAARGFNKMRGVGMFRDVWPGQEFDVLMKAIRELRGATPHLVALRASSTALKEGGAA